jgi:hypothetical protein
MRKILVVAVIVLGSLWAFGATKLSSSFLQGLQDFFAPIVNSKTSLPNTVPAGTIVYENNASTAGFWGLAPDGTWISMGTYSGVSHASWSGYHDTNCAWAWTGTIGDPSAVDSSCTFSQRLNTGFGTVTSYNNGTVGSNFPGIVFTPTKVGNYFICAITSVDDATNSGTDEFQLVDQNATVITSAISSNPGSVHSAIFSITLCGQYYAPSIASTTIKLIGDTGGSGQTGGYTSNAKTIEWSIHQID